MTIVTEICIALATLWCIFGFVLCFYWGHYEEIEKTQKIIKEKEPKKPANNNPQQLTWMRYRDMSQEEKLQVPPLTVRQLKRNATDDVNFLWSSALVVLIFGPILPPLGFGLFVFCCIFGITHSHRRLRVDNLTPVKYDARGEVGED
jgi:hypothetical protein